MKRALILAIKAYKRFVSPLLPPSCRFQPSCSIYAVHAVKKYGVLKGSWLALWRIVRCNPFSKGGYDPVK